MVLTETADVRGLPVKLMKFQLEGSFLARTLSRILEMVSIYIILFISIKESSLSCISYKVHKTWL